MRAGALLCLLFGSAATSSAQNIVSNGGFDSSVTGWNAGGCTVTWNPSDAGGAASSGSAKVVSPTFMPPDFCLAQTITAPENAAYAFTAKALSGGSGPAGVAFLIRALAADGHELNFRRYPLSWSPSWQALSVVFVTPLGTAKVQIGVNVPDTYFIDDIGLRPTSAPAPVVSAFRASKARLCKGESASLFWGTDYASSVTIDHGIGAQPVNTRSSTGPSIAPIQTTTYTITASGPGGSATATATLPVDDGPPGITFTATPSTIGPGQPSTLAWAVTSAVLVSLQAGNDDGSEVAANGTQQVSPAQTTVYTITALGACATSSKQVTVTVTPPKPQISFTASPRTIAEGETATLSWNVLNATGVSIDHGIGSRPAAGSTSVLPATTTTYRLTAAGPGGSSSAQVTVTVLAAPVISFSATPSTITRGSASTLAWTVTDATLVVIDNGIGAQAPNGALEVRPTETMTYLLTASGPGGVRLGQATITVNAAGRRRSVRK